MIYNLILHIMDISADSIPKKKKGRKPKNYYLNLLQDTSGINLVSNTNNNNIDSSGVKIPKKRGRKPKGGKLISIKSIYTTDNISQNVILHLNCRKNDLNYSYKYDPHIKSIENYDFNKMNFSSIYFDSSDNIDILNNKSNSYKLKINNDKNNNNNNNNNNNTTDLFFNNNNNNNNNNININNNNINNNNNNNNINNNDDNKNNNTKDNKNLYKKITILEYNLNKGVSKKGACFWCTCEFKNESIFIPKNCINDTYYVYGNFCSPSCACGYLFNENIDTSCKFERYFLLNNLYLNNYSNNKNIVPAPEPYYILDKFSGNLSIDEYRKLNDNNKYILLIKKPISKVLPELFEDNYEFKTNNKYLFNN